MSFGYRNLAVAAVVAGGLLVPTAVAAAASTHSTRGTTSTVRVIDCVGSKATVTPKGFVYSCADANTVMSGIHWSKWGAAKTAGAGKLTINDCTPNCADGKFHTENASIQLSQIKKVKGALYYSHVRITPSAPNKYHFRVLNDSLPG